MATKNLDLKEFAQRVERLCDSFLYLKRRNGSKQIVELEKLKEDAVDIQFGRVQIVSK